MSLAISLSEKGIVPDTLVRWGMRRLISARLSKETLRAEERLAFIKELAHSPVALVPEKANEQHYEVPPGFFERTLGKRLKYSSCYWPEGVTTLDAAELESLKQVAERAGIANGQRVLELGCGWGSFSLWAAEAYPDAKFTAVSNSAPQRRFIEGRAEARGLANLRVITVDMNEFAIDETFDRVVSIEMFEHMRNYKTLLSRIASWLAPGGRLFVHVFSHKHFTYPFEVEGQADWMAKYFFTGGIMPAETLFDSFQDDLKVVSRWPLSGEHYQKTAEAWLENLDRRRDEVREHLLPVYGKETEVWIQRWRMFFMACAELFGFEGGDQWGVTHTLFEKP
ncbi:MAG: SAM-dependent methyltransferase [Elusimicrobia bacterium]|nr:MAG: SAM-dependent methyltransferase [Elusimicrobiota bacterium]